MSSVTAQHIAAADDDDDCLQQPYCASTRVNLAILLLITSLLLLRAICR